jgi:hypothetical protein
VVTPVKLIGAERQKRQHRLDFSARGDDRPTRVQPGFEAAE